MDILFVGTGAADYEAGLTCPCANCLNARTLGGRNLRTYSSVLIDDSLLVDCGRTVPWRMAELDVEISGIRAVLITHSHADHLDADALARIAAVSSGDAPPVVYGNDLVADTLLQAGSKHPVRVVQPGQRLTVGDHEVLVLPATHDWVNQQSLNYVISRGDAAVLYATDTAWPSDEWWALLDDRCLSCAIVEATFGPLDEDGHPDCLSHHLNTDSAGRLIAQLRERGILPRKAPAFATHLSLHWLPPHDRYAAQVNCPTCELAYDGLRLNLSSP